MLFRSYVPTSATSIPSTTSTFLPTAAPPHPPTLPLPPSLEFAPPWWDEAANVLWLLSLFLALLTASLSIFIIYWLRHFLEWEHPSSRQWTQGRNFLYDGLLTWRVFDLIAIMPLLLQAAILLFLVGLVFFLHRVKGAVWWFTVAVAVMWTVMLLFFIITPFFSRNCPYHTVIFHQLVGLFRCRRHSGQENPYENWVSRCPKDGSIIRSASRGCHVSDLTNLNSALMNDDFTFYTLAPAVLPLDLHRSLDFCRRLVSIRVGNHVSSFIQLHAESYGYDIIPARISETLLAILSLKLSATTIYGCSNKENHGYILEAAFCIAGVVSSSARQRIFLSPLVEARGLIASKAFRDIFLTPRSSNRPGEYRRNVKVFLELACFEYVYHPTQRKEQRCDRVDMVYMPGELISRHMVFMITS